jgi:hypothetical protein
VSSSRCGVCQFVCHVLCQVPKMGQLLPFLRPKKCSNSFGARPTGIASEVSAMTIPVGAGKNACFGYENEQDNQVTSGQSSSAALICQAPETSQSPSAQPAAAEHAQSDGKASGNCVLDPDYFTLSGNAGFFVQAVVSGTVDRYGNIYTAGGGGLGAGVGGALHEGYLRDPDHPCDPPDDATLKSFLSGPALSGGVSSGASISVTHSSGMTAVELGIGTPQVGVSYALGAEHGGEP